MNDQLKKISISPWILIICLLLCFGLGWLVGCNNGESAKQKPANQQALIPGPTEEILDDSATRTVGQAIPIERAYFWKENFMNEAQATGKGNKTECIVHDLESFLAYVDTVKKFFNSTQRPGLKNGIALYLGKSYNYNYMQIRGTNKNHLLKDNYTVFLMPVFFSEKDTTLDFYKVDDNRTVRTDVRDVPVKIIDKLESPFDDMKKSKFNTDLYKRARRLLDGDDGFDLGHTKP